MNRGPSKNFNETAEGDPLLDWATGALPPRKAAKIEAEINADPELARRAEEVRETLDLITDWLEEAPHEPARLEAMMIPPLPNARVATAIRPRSRTRAVASNSRQWFLAAAILMLIPVAAAWIYSWTLGGSGRPVSGSEITSMKAGQPIWLNLGGEVTAPGSEIATATGARQIARLARDVAAALNTQTRARILDESSLSLAEGSVWLWVKPGGAGYTVHTPAGDVRTLGTQFGVSLKDGKLTVEVVQGKVRVSDPAGGEGIVDTGHVMESAGAVADAPPRTAGLRLPDWVQDTVVESSRTMRHVNLPSKS